MFFALVSLLFIQLRSIFVYFQSIPRSRREQQSPTLRQPFKLHEVKHPNSANTDIDIIAIHGLDTNSSKTWTWKKDPKDENEPGVNWLTLDCMLPNVVGHARIFMCDWPSSLLESNRLAENTIEELARVLLSGIKAERSACPDDRPLLFIASCLGGIILMEALNEADDTIQKATRGIIFLATPFRGTAFADVANWAEPGLRALGFVQGRRMTKFLEFAKAPTPKLSKLRRDFSRLVYTHNYTVHTFYEKGYTNLYRKIPWLPSLPIHKKQLVNEDSGTLDCDPNPLPLDRPHVQMNKFENSQDPEYEKVAGAIGGLLKSVRNGTLLQRADKHIINIHYAPRKLEIKRISDEALPMDRCYINLAIVEQPRERIYRSGDSSKDTAARSSPFSISARLKINKPDKDLQVQLPKLFGPRMMPGGDTREPRRILIRGRAGVGKTTLCKKIVYDFTYGNLWENLFSRILWVPLRRLKEPGCPSNYGKLFYYIYFQNHPDGEVIAHSLWQTVVDTTGSRTLFILDGLDEVSELLSQNHPAHTFLTELLNSPNVIITTRPHAVPPTQFDLEMETIGFYPDQVQNYLKTVVQDPELDKIRSFLRKRPLIQNLVRIPVQLDALCYAWSRGVKFDDIPETMTAIYESIIDLLWRKDIRRLDPKRDGVAAKMNQYEMNRSTKTENELLECLAFSGMNSMVVEFEKKHREDICRIIRPPDNIILDDLLEKLSFLRTSTHQADSSQQSYHFLHLTIQEFFAAQYFVRQWEAGSELKYHDFEKGAEVIVKPYEFLQLNKYNTHYDIVWRFTVGLLEGDKARRFFDAIEHEPRDLFGPTHQRLVMHCLSEATTLDSKRRSDLESRLSQWLRLECHLGESFLLEESEFPDGALLGPLTNGSLSLRRYIASKLVLSGKYLSEETVKASVHAIKDDPHRWWKYNSLASQSNLSEAAITAFMELLEHEYEDKNAWKATARDLASQTDLSEPIVAVVLGLVEDKTNYGAAKDVARIAIMSQKTLSEATVAKLFQLFKENGNYGFRAAAVVGALKGQTDLLETYVTELLTLIKDTNNSNLADDAAKILGKQTHLSEVIITTLSELIKSDEREFTRKAASIALQNQTSLSSDAVTTLVGLIQDTGNSRNVRLAAAHALGTESDLPETANAAIISLFDEDTHVHDHIITTKIFLKQTNLSQPIIDSLLKVLQCKGEEPRHIAQVLGNQKSLSPETVIALEELIKDEKNDSELRCAAADSLTKQTNLSKTTTIAIAKLIQRGDIMDVKYNASVTLSNQAELSNETTAILVELIKDKSKLIDGTLPIMALRKQTNLSEGVVKAIVEQFGAEHELTVFLAAIVLENQSTLSKNTVTALLNFVRNNDFPFAAKALGQRSTLFDKVLGFFRFGPESDRSTESTSSTSLDLQIIESLYVTFLYRSFGEQCWSYIKDGKLVINLPNESLTIPLVDGGSSCLTAIDGTRRSLWRASWRPVSLYSTFLDSDDDRDFGLCENDVSDGDNQLWHYFSWTD
ncbi:armadillo-type protein [Hypoxylon cercidicola]|nr:armadillo-type protein [Hypoxylon cercidicola]